MTESRRARASTLSRPFERRNPDHERARGVVALPCESHPGADQSPEQDTGHSDTHMPPSSRRRSRKSLAAVQRWF